MSLLKSNAVQIGQSLTPTNNFVWYQPATPDGTIRLANGNAGEATDILTINSSGGVTFPGDNTFSGTNTFNGSVSFTGSVVGIGTSASSADIKLYEDTDNGTNYVSLKAPASIANNVTWTLPTADGTSGQLLSTDGSGTLAWTTPAPGFTSGEAVAISMIFGG